MDLVQRRKKSAEYQLSKGEVIGNWRMLGPIARGGMGEVYKAEHVRNPAIVGAFKIMLAHMTADERAVRRMLQEADSLARIQHPNIVRYLDGGYSDAGMPFIVIEHLDGITLQRAMESEGRMEVPDALDICAEIADGVHAAHEVGVLHRDLKPANVFLTEDGRVKVLDFGIAKPFAGKALQGKIAPTTEANMVIGTAIYLAPEQLIGDKEQIGRHTDVFSLGVIAYELLTGASPWAENDGTIPSFDVVGNRIVLLEATPLTQRFEGFPEEVSAVVRTAMAKPPRDRFSTASLFAERFRRARSAYLASRGLPQGPLDRLVQNAQEGAPRRGGTVRALPSVRFAESPPPRNVPPAPPPPTFARALDESPSLVAVDFTPSPVLAQPVHGPRPTPNARGPATRSSFRDWVNSWWHPIYYFIFTALLLAVIVLVLRFVLGVGAPTPATAPSSSPSAAFSGTLHAERGHPQS